MYARGLISNLIAHIYSVVHPVTVWVNAVLVLVSQLVMSP
uniref:Uncharacterized protein n=1 Tax=Anguilla anguilla TaxID=7936 RepID=A0A0E9U0R2_ANGAN